MKTLLKRSNKYKLLLLFILLFTVCVFYDIVRGNNDGLIGRIYFYRLFLRISILLALIYSLLYFAKSRNGVIKTIAYNVLFTFVFLGVFELMAFGYYKFTKTTPNIKPSHILWYENPDFIPVGSKKQLYYGDLESSFGRWRVPNGQLDVERCGDTKKIHYQSNSQGLRDAERISDTKKRLVFLGDSFTEGVLVNTEDRLSNILEKKTGLEHVNFGINGANPLVYSLIYTQKALANVDHDAVLVGLFMGNDFETNKTEVNARFINLPIYRPFWNKPLTSDSLSIAYTLANVGQSFESHNVISRPEILRNTRDSLFSTLPFYKKIWVDMEINSYLLNFVYQKGFEMAKANYFKNYKSNFEHAPLGTPNALDFEYSLHKLIEAAKSKKVVFVLIPDIYDINQYKKSKINTLKARLDKIYGPKGAQVIDLLPAFAKYAGDPQKLYITCDGHWTEAGNKFAAEALMAEPVYKDLIQTISSK